MFGDWYTSWNTKRLSDDFGPRFFYIFSYDMTDSFLWLSRFLGAQQATDAYTLSCVAHSPKEVGRGGKRNSQESHKAQYLPYWVGVMRGRQILRVAPAFFDNTDAINNSQAPSRC
jgi:hypothetical protein